MIKITDAAKTKIIEVLDQEKSSRLRFGLQGGGCNGFTYVFTIADTTEDDDFEFKLSDSHVVLVDAMSNMYLEGAEIDYKKDLMGESFVFNNPLQKGSCGCGNSVSF